MFLFFRGVGQWGMPGCLQTILPLCGSMQGLDLVVCASSDETAIKKVSCWWSWMYKRWHCDCFSFSILVMYCLAMTCAKALHLTGGRAHPAGPA